MPLGYEPDISRCLDSWATYVRLVHNEISLILVECWNLGPQGTDSTAIFRMDIRLCMAGCILTPTVEIESLYGVIFMHTCIYIYICNHIYIYMCTDRCISIYIYLYMYVYIHYSQLQRAGIQNSMQYACVPSSFALGLEDGHISTFRSVLYPRLAAAHEKSAKSTLPAMLAPKRRALISFKDQMTPRVGPISHILH